MIARPSLDYHADVGDSMGTTLSHDEGSHRRAAGPAAEPVLVLALECSRPGSLSTRHRLAGLSAVNLGRGSERKIERSAAELTIRVPDRWMSSRHARIEHSFGRWILVDAESKNGSTVDGLSTRRAVLTDGSLIELGHTLFLFFEKMPLEGDEALDLDLASAAREIPGLATLSPELGRELSRLRQVAASEISVLLEGESGTGKEVLARAIHALSGRPGAFVAVNSGALPDNLVESELFGYRKGAFCGGPERSLGLVRAANRGTLFLDEIGDLPAGGAGRAAARVAGARGHADRRHAAGVDRSPRGRRHPSRSRRDGRRQARSATISTRASPASAWTSRRSRIAARTSACSSASCTAGSSAIRRARTPASTSRPRASCSATRGRSTCASSSRRCRPPQVLAGVELVRGEHLPDTVRTGRAPGAPRPVVLSEADQQQRDALVASLREHLGNISAVARALDKDRKQIQRWIKRFGLDPTEYR